MQKTLNKSELKGWLKGAGAVAILSLSLANSTTQMSTNISSLSTLGAVIEKHEDFFGDGPYIVEYEPIRLSPDDEIEYANFAFAITALTKITNGPVTGGYQRLINALSDYEYIVKVSEESFGLCGYILIALPVDPKGLYDLVVLLSSHSLAFGLPDESGEIHAGNSRFGNGLSI